jgi:hypothetical protein
MSCARFSIDATRLKPAYRHNDGLDYVPTNRYVLFGHHFAAIAGAGPLVGPVLAAQMGYLPGTLWILAGVVFAGVQPVEELSCRVDLVVVLAPREDRHLVEVFGKQGRRSIERSVMQTRSTLDHDLMHRRPRAASASFSNCK